MAEKERIAVGGALGHELGAEGAARAGAVLDQHLLLPRLGQLLRHDAREHVVPPEGGNGTTRRTDFEG